MLGIISLAISLSTIAYLTLSKVNILPSVEKEPEFCNFISPLAEYNLVPSSYNLIDDGYGDEFNVVNSKSKKVAKMQSNSRIIKYNHEGDKDDGEGEHSYNITFGLRACNCIERVERETKNAGSLLAYFRERVCAEEKCYNQLTSDEIQMLNQTFLADEREFCNQQEAKSICECTKNEYLEVWEKYFVEPLSQEEKEILLDKMAEILLEGKEPLNE